MWLKLYLKILNPFFRWCLNAPTSLVSAPPIDLRGLEKVSKEVSVAEARTEAVVGLAPPTDRGMLSSYSYLILVTHYSVMSFYAKF